MAARRARNTNRQGANFELQIMEHLREFGYDVLRSSGSRGAVDVVAVGDPHTLWIQAKITNPVISPAERDAVRSLALRAGHGFGGANIPIVSYRIKGSVYFRSMTGPGPREFEVFRPWLHGHAVCACGHQHDEHARGTGCWHRQDSGPSCGCIKFTFPSEARKAERNERDRLARAEARRMREETP